MFSGVPTEFSERVGGSEGCGLERQAWRQWDSVCGGVHSGPGSDDSLGGGTGAESQRRQEKNRWSGWRERKSRSGPQGVRDKEESGTCVSSRREWRVCAAY